MRPDTKELSNQRRHDGKGPAVGEAVYRREAYSIQGELANWSHIIAVVSTSRQRTTALRVPIRSPALPMVSLPAMLAAPMRETIFAAWLTESPVSTPRGAMWIMAD